MKDLFFSKDEGIAFWVSGYDYGHSHPLVNGIVENLLECSKKMSAKCKVDISTIKTATIDSSRRYKYMRVFYCNTHTCPEGAFEISGANGWTMWKWLND